MKRRLLAWAGLAALSLPGCAAVDASAKVDEAAGLVAARTGHTPEWKVPWDHEPPAWDGSRVLTLDAAVVMALRNNRDLRTDVEMIGQANADLVQAGLLANPSLNFMMMMPEGGGRTMLRSNGMPMESLEQLWLIPVRQQVARTQLQAAILRVADRAVEVAAAVKRVYAELQYTQRAIELTRENMRVVDQSTRIIEARQAAGRATQVSVNLSQIRFLRLRSELMAIDAAHRAAQRELLMLMGVATASDAWRVDPASETGSAVEPPPDEDALLRVAASQRLDFKAAEWTLLAAGHRIELMHREGWPKMSLALSFERGAAPRAASSGLPSRFGNAAAGGIVNSILGGQPSPPMPQPFRPNVPQVDFAIGPMLDLELPIFDQNQAQVAKAVHEYRQSLAMYESRWQEIARAVRESLVRCRQAHDQVCFYRDQMLPAVDRNVALARQSYIAGQEDLTIYLQAQEDLLMTRLKTLEFLREYSVRRADLERQAGGRLELPAATTQPAVLESVDAAPTANAAAQGTQP